MSEASRLAALEAAFRQQAANRVRLPNNAPYKPPLNGWNTGPIPRVRPVKTFVPPPQPLVLPKPPINLFRLGGNAIFMIIEQLVNPLPAGDANADREFGERNRNRRIAPPPRTRGDGGVVPFRGGQTEGIYDVWAEILLKQFHGQPVPDWLPAIELNITMQGKITVLRSESDNMAIRIENNKGEATLRLRHQVSTDINQMRNPYLVLRDGVFDGGGDPQGTGGTADSVGNTIAPPPPLSFDTGNGTGTGQQTRGFGTAPPPPVRERERTPPPFREPIAPPPPPIPTEIPPPIRTPAPTEIPNNPRQPAPDRRIGAPFPTTAPPPPIVTPDIQPIPTPFPPPTRDPDRVPFPPPTIQPTEQPPQLPPRDPAIEQILQTQLEQSDLLQQIPFLIPTILNNSQPFQDAVRSRVTESVCQQSQPDGCIANAAENAATGVKNKVDASDAANAAGFAAILAKLVTMFDWIKAAFNNTIVDKAVAYMTLITSIHNAAMLSTSIKDTLGEALSLGLATVGIKTPEGSPIDINEAVNKSAENLIKGVIGNSNYLTLSVTWAKASRIWQSGAAIIYNVRSLWDSARSLNELTGNNVGKIGNSLRKDGVVSENAYKNMSENNVQVNVAMQKLENLDDAASTLSAITSETFGITENLVELTKQRTDFDKNVKDLAPKVQVENDPLKAKEVAEKAASVSPPIVDADLFKPDV